jgi:DNA-binding NarL/FixJ family response regulator
VKLRIVVAERDPDFLREFVSILSPEFEIIATVVDGESAVRSIRHCRPDIAILDLEMQGINGIEVTKRVMCCPPYPAVVICSLESDPEIVEAALQAGALGYILKARTATDLTPAVKAVAIGHQFVSSY